MGELDCIVNGAYFVHVRFNDSMKARINMYLVHVRCEVKRIPRITVGSVEQR